MSRKSRGSKSTDDCQQRQECAARIECPYHTRTGKKRSNRYKEVRGALPWSMEVWEEQRSIGEEKEVGCDSSESKMMDGEIDKDFAELAYMYSSNQWGCHGGIFRQMHMHVDDGL